MFTFVTKYAYFSIHSIRLTLGLIWRLWTTPTKIVTYLNLPKPFVASKTIPRTGKNIIYHSRIFSKNFFCNEIIQIILLYYFTSVFLHSFSSVNYLLKELKLLQLSLFKSLFFRFNPSAIFENKHLLHQAYPLIGVD